MKALCIESPGLIRLRDISETPLLPGECRVAVTMVGICRTDLELAKGYMNFSGVPGHEFVGKVVEGPDRLMGRRVVGEINAGCGACDECRNNGSRHCANRTVLGIFNRPGAFAESLTLPERNLLPVPDNVSDEEAVFTEPLAAALEICEQLHVRPSAKTLVIGDGKLGLLIAQVYAHFGARVMLLGRNPKKLALAERWQVPAALNESGETPSVFFGGHFDHVVECTGSPGGLACALSHVAPRGTIVLKSTYAPSQPPCIDWAKIVVDEISVVGSRCGPFAPALRLLSRGGIDVRSLIDHRKTLEEGVEAFELAARKGVLKVLVSV